MNEVVGSNSSYKPITNTAWVRVQLCKLQKGCTRLAAASDKVYQLLAQSRWFCPGTPASSTTKTSRHDIAEILLKVALKHKKKQKKTKGAMKFGVWLYCCILLFVVFMRKNPPMERITNCCRNCFQLGKIQRQPPDSGHILDMPVLTMAFNICK